MDCATSAMLANLNSVSICMGENGSMSDPVPTNGAFQALSELRMILCSFMEFTIFLILKPLSVLARRESAGIRLSGKNQGLSRNTIDWYKWDAQLFNAGDAVHGFMDMHPARCPAYAGWDWHYEWDRKRFV